MGGVRANWFPMAVVLLSARDWSRPQRQNEGTPGRPTDVWTRRRSSQECRQFGRQIRKVCAVFRQMGVGENRALTGKSRRQADPLMYVLFAIP
jgi:hypothetical protein